MDQSGTHNKQPIRILLVEDNDAHVKLILRAFKEDRLANPVHVVSDGEQALDYLYRRGDYQDPIKSPRPDMILLDLKLPKIDGLEILKTVKEDVKLKDIPVVVLTSSTDQRDVHEAYRHYVNSYIAKPVDFDKFRQVVQELDYYWTIFNTKPS
ncbi:MAG: response regulator [Sulfuricaulis sp.]|uniref:response regulator n=1 Tax=Sulfuricaulis sp. TaxID=2003553 RepID=UPI003C4B0B90